MNVRWALGGVAAVIVAVLVIAGAVPVLHSEAKAHRTDPGVSPGTAPGTSHTTGPAQHVVVAFGDSVPSGAACSCNPFPSIYGSLLRERTGADVTVHNYGVSGLDTNGLLAQLKQPKVVDDARQADVFLVTIGANDFEDHHDQVVEGICATPGTATCVDGEIDSMRANLSKALSDIRSLRNGKPTSVLVTGYWNVFEDGQVARRASGNAGLQASIQLTRRVNTTIQAVANRAGARYVDLFAPFQSHGRGIDQLMAPDGDHPDAAGHRLIADTLLDAGLPRMSTTP